MKILVINSGSSSIKYQLFKMPQEEVICSGLVERIGLNDAEVHYKSTSNTIDEVLDIPNHKIGLEKVVTLLLDEKVGVIKSTSEIEAVGHRVVHGGSTFSKTTIVNKEVKNKIKELFSLAPQHNPANYEGIVVAEAMFPNAKQIAVFDTAFHQTIPVEAYKYAIPNKFLTEENIRLYGFHGTSHKYVSEKAIDYLGLDKSKIITIHLGNGCSMTAIKNGKSIDHTLGFGPVTGLIMGSRSGDIDHAIIFHLVNNLGYSLDEVNTMLQKESGMFGLTGFSDLRDIEAEAEKGNKECQLALEMNAYRIKKYIGSYATIMNGLDAIIFTAGIGENSITIRRLVCTNMDYLGIELDEAKNDIRAKKITEIQKESAKTKILIIPTNEEVEIAKQSFELIN
ncbi:MAG: acetate kinase [Lutibacter sp.]|uniref:acetate/propionate family kinase n=1 Tax=Lutibacter sp. TaxID=1925666 RepID=UPI0017C39D79|nr:acetate kinase [Lutibacter sp.]MBT8316138.1 acetate kinase [Lutibacter sp.]NNJ56998.1 acetate kinase [Lutibacter sp.]